MALATISETCALVTLFWCGHSQGRKGRAGGGTSTGKGTKARTRMQPEPRAGLGANDVQAAETANAGAQP